MVSGSGVVLWVNLGAWPYVHLCLGCSLCSSDGVVVGGMVCTRVRGGRPVCRTVAGLLDILLLVLLVVLLLLCRGRLVPYV